MIPRKKRRDHEVDEVRTKIWFWYLGKAFGSSKPRDVQRALESTPTVREDVLKNNRYLNYSRGKHLPREAQINLAASYVPDSAIAINHALWKVLRCRSSIEPYASEWIGDLAPNIQSIVLGSHKQLRVHGGRHYLGALERRASLDSLAALTIVFKMSQERGEKDVGWELAQSILRVLLLLGPMFDEQKVAAQIFRLYVTRIFVFACLEGRTFDLEKYDYITSSYALDLMGDILALKQKGGGYKLPTYYSLQILQGPQKICFDPLLKLYDGC